MGLAQRFMELFAGLPRAHGQYRMTRVDGTKNKMQGKAQTVLEPVSEEVWQKHLSGELGLGIVPITDEGTCHWGAIDIDEYVSFDILALEAQIRAKGLPLIVFRTKSGGAHIYLFTEEPVRAKTMRQKLHEFSIALGHAGVEIFPKQIALANERDVGNWLNMPYFDSEKSLRYAIHDGKALAVEEALDFIVTRRLPDESALAALEVPLSAEFADGPPCLQCMATHGVAEGGRNNALFAIGVYLRQKHGDTWEPLLDEYNQKYIQPALPSREVLGVAKSLVRKEYFYPCKKDPLVSLCQKELCKSRKYGIGDGTADEPSVSIGMLTKILTDPPTWIIDVEGVRMELNTDDMLDQNRFRKMCVERINRLPQRLKPNLWEKIVQEKLNNVEMVEAPIDAGPDGRLMTYLEQFCTGYAAAREKDELLAGKPYTEDNLTYFRSQDFSRYLEQQRVKTLSPRELWNTLRRHGAAHKQFNIKGKCVQCWSIPAFNLLTDDISQPSVAIEEKF